jgi:hypothetical protein
MEVLSPSSSVWISYLEEGKDRQGFECENVWLTDKATKNKNVNPIIDDIDNYCDEMDNCTNQRGREIRWKKLLRAILPVKRRENAKHKEMGNKKEDYEYASDASTATASTLSAGSFTSLEGFVITASKFLEEDDREMLDRNIVLDDLPHEISSDNKSTPDGLRCTELEIHKAYDVVFDDATACTTRSKSSSLSSHSNSSKAEPSLMETRLLDTGLVKRSDFHLSQILFPKKCFI